MTQPNDFKKKVKIQLLKRDKDMAWLANEVHERTGLFCDVPYVSKNLSGERNSEKIITAICEILGVKK